MSMRSLFISRIKMFFQQGDFLKKRTFFLRSRIFLSLLFLLFLLPTGFLFFHYAQKNRIIAGCEEELLGTERLLLKLAKSEKGKKEFFSRYGSADKEYISSTLASQLFLKKEEESLELLLSHPDFENSLELQKRLSFLQGKENQLHFIEKEKRVQKGVQESLLEQTAPVEIEMEDLKRLLTLIESVPIPPYLPSKQAPELFITSFHLQKKEISGKKALLLHLNLLQRVPEKVDATTKK